MEAEAAPTPQSLASDRGGAVPDMDSDDEVMSLNGSSGDDFGADEDSSVDFGAAGEHPVRSHDRDCGETATTVAGHHTD